MIVEIHLTLLEEAEHDEHLDACDQAACNHPAHLVSFVADRCSGSADVFYFVADSTARYTKRLRHNKERKDREAQLALTRKQEAKSLAIIRRGWNRLYGYDHE